MCVPAINAGNWQIFGGPRADRSKMEFKTPMNDRKYMGFPGVKRPTSRGWFHSIYSWLN